MSKAFDEAYDATMAQVDEKVSPEMKNVKKYTNKAKDALLYLGNNAETAMSGIHLLNVRIALGKIKAAMESIDEAIKASE